MTFESHKVVKEYINELKTITETREQLRLQLTDTWEQLYKTEVPHERRILETTSKDLEQQINALTTKGQYYMRKVDELNGVR